MENNKKESILAAGLAELIIAAVLVVGILGTLNYFAILPLSQTFPFLAFLPTQGQNSILSQQRPVVNQPGNNNTIRLLNLAVVSSNQPQKFANSGKENLYKYIEKSSVTARQSLRVDLEFSADNSTEASGITFNNSKKYGSKDYRALQIVRHTKDKGSWLLESRDGDKSKFTYLFNSISGKEFKKFTLIITTDGKTVHIITPGIPQKTVQLADSFFAAGKQVSASVSVAPSSELDIYSLYYQY